MAIDFIKGAASQLSNNALQKVAGNVKGLITGQSKTGSDTFALTKNKVDVETFKFPMDIEGKEGAKNSNHGHYIMFFINETVGSSLRFAGDVAKKGDKHMSKELSDRKIPNFINEMKSDVKTGKSIRSKQLFDKLSMVSDNGGFIGNIAQNQLNEQFGGNRKNFKDGGKVISVNRKATKRLNTAIAMYMPQQLSVTYGSRYVDTEISPLGGALGDAVSGIIDKSIGSASDFYNRFQNKIPEEFKRRLILKGLSAIDGLGLTGVREAFEINQGEVIADRMELAFKNVNRRTFTYNFKMIPKSKEEADEIRKIIYAFKFNMLPEMVNGRASATMSFPNTFDIEYRYQNTDNDYIHRVSTCVLENMTVSYGGDRFKTFEGVEGEGAPVVETSINLTFKELELITRERIAEGF